MPSGWRGSTWTRGTDVAWTGSKVNIARARETEIERRRDRGHGEASVGPAEGTPPGRVAEDIVSGCLAEQVAIDRAELGRWLADSGWEQEAVTALADRFFADSEWLAKRLAVMAP